MVSHCANPNCKIPFHYLRGGRLYRFEIKTPQMPCADVPNAICNEKPSRATVYFWMCMDCCRRFYFKLDPRAGVELVPIPKPGQVGSAPVVIDHIATLADQRTA